MSRSKFNPGDECWVVQRDDCGNACEVGGLVFLAEVCDAAITTTYINDYDQLEDLIQYHIEETAENYDTELQVYPIEDCYHTRDEAHRALEEESEDESDDE